VLLEERREFRGSFSGYERDRLFYNTNGSSDRFVQSAYVFGLDDDHDGRAAAPVDIDGDGDLDLALVTLQGLRLFENRAAPQHFARVRLTANRSQAQAIGATVELTAGGTVRRDFVKITEGFQTQVPFDLHFGLGDVATIDALEVRWPSGAVERWDDLPVDRLLYVSEGATEIAVDALGRWPDGTRPHAIGAPTPTLEARQLDGDVVPVAGGRPTVINFWAPWCAPCNVELPQLVSLAERYGDEVDFVGMSVELADLESVRASIDTFAIPYAQFLADEVVMERFFGNRDEAALPSTYVFDHAGRLRRLFRGAITEADLDALLLSFRDEGVFEADLELVARTSFRAGDYEEAIVYYRRLIDLDYQIGLASLRLGNLEEAREALEQVVARSPTNALAQFNLGLVRFRSGEVGDALRSFQAASDLGGNDHVVLQQLGNAAAEAGQFWLAGDAFDRATAANPTSAVLWADKARVHRSRGQIDRARESYTRALALDPANAAIRQELDDMGVPDLPER
jgi:thiol-disulfide isomerase/thioredoxin